MAATIKCGIDVSKYQGDIVWNTVKSSNTPPIDFAIIRAGFGINNVDEKFKRNADECTRLSIPFGAYWFSYATTPEEAKQEADYICNLLDPYKVLYPVCYDYEYNSYEYSEKVGIKPTKERIIAMATAFLERVRERGYYPMLYTNPDYIKRYFSELVNKYDLWLAHWGVSKPGVECGMWQTGTKTVKGVAGDVDYDYSYNDYPALIGGKYKQEELKEAIWEKYYNIAKEVWQGKWGAGEDRKAKLLKAGYDANVVQQVVNYMAEVQDYGNT